MACLASVASLSSLAYLASLASCVQQVFVGMCRVELRTRNLRAKKKKRTFSKSTLTSNCCLCSRPSMLLFETMHAGTQSVQSNWSSQVDPAKLVQPSWSRRVGPDKWTQSSWFCQTQSNWFCQVAPSKLKLGQPSWAKLSQVGPSKLGQVEPSWAKLGRYGMHQVLPNQVSWVGQVGPAKLGQPSWFSQVGFAKLSQVGPARLCMRWLLPGLVADLLSRLSDLSSSLPFPHLSCLRT